MMPDRQRLRAAYRATVNLNAATHISVLDHAVVLSLKRDGISLT
jgi:hypothetical protein